MDTSPIVPPQARTKPLERDIESHGCGLCVSSLAAVPTAAFAFDCRPEEHVHRRLYALLFRRAKSVRPTALTLTCAARAWVPKSERRDGCRGRVAKPRLANCNRRDAVTFAKTQPARPADRSRAAAGSVWSWAAALAADVVRNTPTHLGVHFQHTVKKRELERRLLACGWRFLRHGSRHDVWTDGEDEEYVPRHAEVNEQLARAILRKACKERI
jgi:mRNA interferase HicA